MIVDIRAGTVRIITGNGDTAGTGFIVTEEGLIVTCAHVVQSPRSQANGDQRPHSLAVKLANGETLEAVLLDDGWRAWDAEDIAILRIQGALPAGVIPLPLGRSDGTDGHRFETYGYPDLEAVEALRGYGKVRGKVPRPGLPDYLMLTGSGGITRGFSGGPVWDTHTARVIGMVDSFPEEDEYGRLAGITFVTPSELIRQACSELQIVETCPYRPLQPFTEGDVGLFFGRETIQMRIIERVRHDRFVAILGPSGCGKSSLIQAGVIPRLRTRGGGTRSPYDVFVTRPNEDPPNDLERQGLKGAAAGLLKAVESWYQANCRVLCGRRRLILIFDQFEELLIADPASRRYLLDTLRSILAEPLLPVTVALVMWDAFYSRLLEMAPFLSGPLESRTINIPPTLAPTDVEAMVRRPAGAVGLSVETDLIGLILRDSAQIDARGGESEIHVTILPLLQLALADLWERRRDGVLSIEGYFGIKTVLSNWMDAACRELRDQRLIPYARRTFIDLVYPGNLPEGIPDSRRRRTLAELYRIPGDQTERNAVDRAITQLTGARLLVIFRDGGGRELIEIISDTVVTQWDELRGWLNEHRRLLDWRRVNGERVRQWATRIASKPKGRTVEGLLRGKELAEFEAVVAGNEALLTFEEKTFLEASRRLRDHEAAKARWLVGILSTLLVLAIVGGALATWQWRRASELVTWRPTVGRTAGSRGPRRTNRICNESSRDQGAVKTHFAACQSEPRAQGRPENPHAPKLAVHVSDPPWLIEKAVS